MRFVGAPGVRLRSSDVAEGVRNAVATEEPGLEEVGC
jgi:hypothetical protein